MGARLYGAAEAAHSGMEWQVQNSPGEQNRSVCPLVCAIITGVEIFHAPTIEPFQRGIDYT